MERIRISSALLVTSSDSAIWGSAGAIIVEESEFISTKVDIDIVVLHLRVLGQFLGFSLSSDEAQVTNNEASFTVGSWTSVASEGVSGFAIQYMALDLVERKYKEYLVPSRSPFVLQCRTIGQRNEERHCDIVFFYDSCFFAIVSHLSSALFHLGVVGLNRSYPKCDHRCLLTEYEIFDRDDMVISHVPPCLWLPGIGYGLK